MPGLFTPYFPNTLEIGKEMKNSGKSLKALVSGDVEEEDK